jgi:RNA polymerase-binding transcription factor DksA
MRRSHVAASPVATQQLKRLLQLRQLALQREWALHACHSMADDDLLPAPQRIEEGLVQVALALHRANGSRYGVCVNCGGSIDFQRLLAHPAATRCWPCQQAAEAAEAPAAAASAHAAH